MAMSFQVFEQLVSRLIKGRSSRVSLAACLLLGLMAEPFWGQTSNRILGDKEREVSEARSLLENGNTLEAEQRIRAYLLTNTNSGTAHFVLGLVLFKETRPAESLAEFTAGAKFLQPGSYELQVVALDYVLLGDYIDADKWLTKSLEMSPSNPEAWYYLGRTKYNENRFNEAIQAFQQCLKLDPKNVKAEDNLGLSYAGLDRGEEAADAYRQAIAWQEQALEKNPGPYLDFGNLLLDENRTAEALPYLRTATTIFPNNSKAHAALGKAYERLNQFSDARQELETAARLTPDDPALHLVLARVYRKMGLTEKARIETERSSALRASSTEQALTYVH